MPTTIEGTPWLSVGLLTLTGLLFAVARSSRRSTTRRLTMKERGWRALKSAEFVARSVAEWERQVIHAIHYVAVFESWSKNAEVLIFYPTDADVVAARLRGCRIESSRPSAPA